MITPSELERMADAIAERVACRLAGRDPDAFIDVHQAAALLGCSVPTVERMTKAGLIPSHKFNRLRRYRPSELLSARKGGCNE
jgi:excisionase family DNA binding protein